MQVVFAEHDFYYCQRSAIVAFQKDAGRSEELPPTQAALAQTVMRANYQAMVWNNDIVPLPHYHHQITFWLDVAGQQMASCDD